MEKWKILEEKDVFKTRVFTIKNLHCYHPGKEVRHGFYILETPDWINVVALTEAGEFIFVKQHRMGTDEHTLETPAGLIEEGEDPLEAAGRELLEETGYEAGTIRLMKRLSANPAIMNNHIHFFCATGCRKTKNQKLDQAEDIEVHLFSPVEVLRMMDSGEINHSVIITALCLYLKENPPVIG